MPIVKSKPTSPGRRHHIRVDIHHLHKGDPHKPLIAPLAGTGGRNNKGRITVRHRGGGAKRRYRIIDFKRDKKKVEGTVERLEYDPNRSAHIALIKYLDGDRRYIIAPQELRVGDKLVAADEAVEISPGNAMPLNHMPLGTVLHCLELRPGKGAQLIRSAGSAAQLVAKEGAYATVRLRSGEVRRVLLRCRATVGAVGNSEHTSRSLGKAGARRWRGVRPTVRGVAMNPVDHPHGGGEGKTSGGRHPVSPWGVSTKGYKTRHRKDTDVYIVRRRKGGRK